MRGLYGEGTQAYGDLYQISNQVSLGKKEEKIIENVSGVVASAISYERRAREKILSDSRMKVEDRLWRALGMLKNAKVLSSEEMMHLLSAVRFGTASGILQLGNGQLINELFLLTQPAHLQKVVGRALSPDARDIERASFIREKLSAV